MRYYFCTICCRKQELPDVASFKSKQCNSCGRRMMRLDEAVDYLLTRVFSMQTQLDLIQIKREKD